MKYPRILSAIRSAKWAVTPQTLQAIADTLGAHMRGAVTGRSSLMPDSSPKPSMAAGPQQKEKPPIAVINVFGIIGKHLSAMESECGGCDVDAVEAALMAAVDDESVQSVILNFDSPGGVVGGVPELAEKIRRADAIKPVFAFTDTQCCSAAYWLASACRAVFCTKSADLGSIGVYVALCDDSEWWAKQGYKLELIKAGEFKAAGISGKPLADNERAMIQADVDAVYAMFTADVLKTRPGVQNSTMQGQTFMGSAAQSVGLVNEVVGSLDELVAELAPKTQQPSLFGRY